MTTDLEVPLPWVPRVLHHALSHKSNGLLVHDRELSVGHRPKRPQFQGNLGDMTAGGRRTQRR